MSTVEPNEQTFKSLEDWASALKKSIKDTRIEWKSALASCSGMQFLDQRDGQFALAEGMLEELIAKFLHRLRETDPNSEVQKKCFKHLGDCFGVKGGLYRDWRRYADAASAYHQGRAYEVALEALDPKAANSYCMVQELVNRALDHPRELFNEGPLKEAIRDALRVIAKQTSGVREPDAWAWADLALLYLLTDQSRSLAIWREFKQRTTEGDFARASAREALTDLLKELNDTLSDESILYWERAIKMITP